MLIEEMGFRPRREDVFGRPGIEALLEFYALDRCFFSPVIITASLVAAGFTVSHAKCES